MLIGVLSPMRSRWSRQLAREAWAGPQVLSNHKARMLFLLAQDRQVRYFKQYYCSLADSSLPLSVQAGRFASWVGGQVKPGDKGWGTRAWGLAGWYITIVFIITKTIFLSFKMWWHFCLLLLVVKCQEGTVLTWWSTWRGGKGIACALTDLVLCDKLLGVKYVENIVRCWNLVHEE